MAGKDDHNGEPESMRSMLWKGFWAAVGSVACVFLLLFLPAGTWDYWQAWAYLGLFVLYFILGSAYFLKRSPDLLRRRLRVGPAAEEDFSQKVIMSIGSPALLLVFLVPALDRRYLWSSVPDSLCIVAFACCVAGMLIACWATTYNRYMASTITVETGQPVISTGPYARVRHPLYSGIGLWFFFTPLALGSWCGMLAALFVPIMLIFRLMYEERSLRVRLPGYAEYCQKVRWRLIPGVF